MSNDPQDRARRQAEAMYADDAASRALGIEVHDVAPGRARASMRVTSSMVNGHGTCHGGYLFLLADSAFAFACNTHGDPAVAAGADVTFLAPVHEGDALVAEAVERVLRGRSGLYDVTVRRGEEPVLEFRGRSRTVPDRSPSGPDLAAPDLAAPDLAAPDLAAPDLAAPDLAAPDLAAGDPS